MIVDQLEKRINEGDKIALDPLTVWPSGHPKVLVGEVTSIRESAIDPNAPPARVVELKVTIKIGMPMQQTQIPGAFLLTPEKAESKITLLHGGGQA